MMPDERSRHAVIVAEKWADHLVVENERQEAQAAAQDVWDNEANVIGADDSAAWSADVLVRGEFIGDQWVFQNERWASMVASGVLEVAGIQEQPVQASYIRCLIGNPFRPVSVDPSWLTSTVVTLAEGIYQERAFDRLPILADALQDAGCDNDDILTHLRSEGPHARGCWCLDLLLGKS